MGNLSLPDLYQQVTQPQDQRWRTQWRSQELRPSKAKSHSAVGGGWICLPNRRILTARRVFRSLTMQFTWSANFHA
jgi:hypothetical protein